MQKINLRELYPDVYKTDVFVDVAEEVVAAIRGQEQDDAAYERRKFRHKAHYSLNREDGIENDALNRPLTPEEVLEQKLLREEVYAALMQLTAIQARRIYARFYLGMTVAEIFSHFGEEHFRTMTWQEAMDRYGSDKPDTRFGLEFVNVSDIVKDCGFGAFADAVKGGGSVRCINVEGGVEHFTRKQIDAFGDLVKTYRAKGLAWLSMKPEGIQCSFAKFLTEDQIKAILERANAKTGDILFFVADAKDTVVYQALGALRLELGRRLGLMDDTKFNFLWVIEFPQFEWSEEDGRYYAMHHPFTSPMDEDLDLLDTDQGKVRAKAYDIVLNGNDIGGGSIRIHSPEVQEKMFEKLGFTKEEAWERFGFLMGAFKYGTPPHGGLAYGLDRLAMLITRASSIRDVIAFPKVQTASCLMSGCPDVVEQAQLEELHIETVADKE